MNQSALNLDEPNRAAASNIFPPTRGEGLRRLAAFVPRAGRDYASGRNADMGPESRNNVSLLSPYLRHRLITEREVVEAVLARHSPAAAEKYVQEVLWRTYWKGWLEMRPAVWQNYCRNLENTEIGGGLAKAIASAEGGTTGIDGFDDWARELVETGYLHNHARMWFASIWIFTLKLPWVLGADFFMRHLVDGDPASNTLSWRWVAGLQTVGKTYLATADNIARYTEGRFAPKGLAREAVAITEAPVPGAAPIAALAPYDPAIASLLLVTSEDMVPESALPRSANIRGALIARGATPSRFVSGAADDAAARLRHHYGCAVSMVDNIDAAGINAAALAAKAKIIVTPYAPVGPVASALASVESELAAPLIRVRRTWDERFWPFARKGFFAFKEQIPAVLAEEGLRG
jgi:deoxyribodipyrimidine photo-lyase